MRKVKHQTKPDTSCNLLNVNELVERQREREEKGFVMVKVNRTTVRIVTK